MATIVGNNVRISGAPASSTARFRVEWQLAGQEVGNNRSLINWQAYTDFVNSDAQLDGGVVNTSVGTVWNNGGRVYNYTGNFASKTIGHASGSFWVGHGGDGVAFMEMNGGISIYQSGRSDCPTGRWQLPTIPRYAGFLYHHFDWATDAAIRFAWHADRGCDYVSWWSPQIDGGAHHDIYVGNSAGWFIIEQHNLRSNAQYDVKVAIRNAASGLWSESPWMTTFTGNQNNDFGMEF